MSVFEQMYGIAVLIFSLAIIVAMCFMKHDNSKGLTGEAGGDTTMRNGIKITKERSILHYVVIVCSIVCAILLAIF